MPKLIRRRQLDVVPLFGLAQGYDRFGNIDDDLDTAYVLQRHDRLLRLYILEVLDEDIRNFARKARHQLGVLKGLLPDVDLCLRHFVGGLRVTHVLARNRVLLGGGFDAITFDRFAVTAAAGYVFPINNFGAVGLGFVISQI